MHDVLLIHRINPEGELDNKIHQMTFITGEIEEDRAEEIVDLISELDFVDPATLVLKYNGFMVSVLVKNIPQLLKTVVCAGIPVYEVYELYDQ